MEQYQYMPGDPRLVDQLVYELKSKGIFDQFRKECISDVDTKPAYQNLRQRVESSVSTFLSRQTWKPDLNKNQLREKLRKHIMDGNYLEQGVERIVDQVVNPKVASMFIPQVEDLVYNYFGIKRTKTVLKPETSNGNVENDLLPTDLEAVSPGSVKSNDDKDNFMDTSENDVKDDIKMEVDDVKYESNVQEDIKETVIEETKITETLYEKTNIPLPAEEIKPEDIPIPLDSPPKVELDKIELPKDTDPSDIPLPGEIPTPAITSESNFKSALSDDSDEDSDSSDGSLRRNMSPLTPVRTFDEDSNDAQAGFDSETKEEDKKELPISTFRFTIESKSSESSPDTKTADKKEDLSYQFHNQVNINFNTPLYDDSSNSNNLHIDYESDANSKNTETKSITGHSEKKHRDDKKSNSHSSHRHSSSSKDKRSDSKHSSKEKHDARRSDDKKPKDEHHSKSKSSHRERSRDRSDKKDSRDSSKHRQSSSQKPSSRDSKPHRSSSSSHKHSSKSDDKKSSSKETPKDKDVTKSKEQKSSKSSSKDKDRKSSSSRKDDKKEKKDKKDDDHYNASGRGNRHRRSTDRDSNDGNSSSSKGSNNQTTTKTSDNKEKSSKSSNTTTSGSDGTSPSDKEVITENAQNFQSPKAIRIDSHLETPVAQSPVRFMPEMVLKKPKVASNLEEAKRIMKVRKFLDDEQRRMNQEAALLLEFQANVRPSLSQAYSNASGPELEFACVANDQEVETEDDNIFTNECETEEPDVVTQDVLEETIENIADAIQGGANEKVAVEETNSDMESQLDVTEVDETENLITLDDLLEVNVIKEDNRLLFFTEEEKNDANAEKEIFNEFLKKITDNVISKLFLLNCNDCEIEIFKSISPDHSIVNFIQNGQIRNPRKTTINIDNKELVIPLESEIRPSILFSPVKSESSFDLSSDYDTKLEEMVNSKSRQDIMEIILGSAIPEGSQAMKIDICEDEDIESEDRGSKRKICEIDSPDNNNLQVLTSNKIRRLSDSEIITSTTEESMVTPTLYNVRSKYLGKAKRVGLPRPKKPALPTSPSSDVSLENEQPQSKINGLKASRMTVQRYDSADLYKPKLHFLSRRNNIA